MALEQNFVSVSPTIIADPCTKLIITQGRWTPESSARGGAVAIELSYDPELSGDQLTQPASIEDRALFERFGGAAPARTLYRSAQARTLTSFHVDIRDGDDAVGLVFTQTASLADKAELVRGANPIIFGERPYEVLLHALRSIVLMGMWETEYAAQWRKGAVTLSVLPHVAQELTANTGVTFAAAVNGLVQIANRAAVSVAKPFSFKPVIGESFFIDEENELALRLHSWPEYSFSLALEPLAGPQAEAWPLSKRAYYEFMVGIDRDRGVEILRISGALPHVRFDSDFPGRSEELLNVLIPLVCPIYAELTGSTVRRFGVVPHELRSSLRHNKSFFWRRPGEGWPGVP